MRPFASMAGYLPFVLFVWPCGKFPPGSVKAMKMLKTSANILRDLIWLLTGRDRYSPLRDDVDAHLGESTF